MCFDRPHAQAEIRGDLPAGHAGNETTHHLTLSGSETRQALGHLGPDGLCPPRFAITLDRLPDAVEQELVAEGFLNVVHRAAPQGANGRWHVSVGGDDDDRRRHAPCGEFGLKVEPAHLLQPHVEHETTGFRGVVGVQEFARRAIGLSGQTSRLDQPSQRLA